MNKVITISIYPTSDLVWNKGQVFIDHTELNKLLEDGYAIQSQIISNPSGESKISNITFILFKDKKH